MRLHQADLACIAESWCHECMPNAILDIPGYNLLRRDREGGRKGGGLQVYVHSGLVYRILRWPFRATQQNLKYTRDIKNAAEIYFKKCNANIKITTGLCTMISTTGVGTVNSTARYRQISRGIESYSATGGLEICFVTCGVETNSTTGGSDIYSATGGGEIFSLCI